MPDEAVRCGVARQIYHIFIPEGALRMAARERALIAGNWKMNGLQRDGAALAAALAGRAQAQGSADILICPPATLLAACRDALAGSVVALGAQDCHAQPSGAFTGDISARMVKDVGCSHVILGHSERRALHGESNEQVRTKALAALAEGLVAIICVGETEAECDAGQGPRIVEAQLRGSIPAEATAATLVIAYEPVWAIGTGRTPSEADIDRMHRHIRDVLAALLPDGAAIRVLYGGSVKASNAAEILARPDVDGALVGGASLKAEEFWAIVEAAAAG
jgi:triosephosphate isomerase